MSDILPNAEKAVIPIEKLVNYSLNFERSPDKAIAFATALGYTIDNADKLIKNINENIWNHKAVFKGNNGFGDIYEIIMRLIGENGKSANVLTGWIVENGLDYPRLTNVYVTKKNLRGDRNET
ncbi:MAG: hypothetical protein FWD34_05105 [Oscillospiraceae bacterium]|nr:hypothetical protein [Oscillospiraceae bacterium]